MNYVEDDLFSLLSTILVIWKHRHTEDELEGWRDVP